MSIKSTNQKLRVEQLEKRELFAGDVLAFMDSDGALNIYERTDQAGSSQSIELVRRPFSYGGYIQVVGKVNESGATTLINGLTSQSFYVPGGNVRVLTGAGNDTVRIKNAPLNNVLVDTGIGQDRVFLENANTRGSVTLRMGSDYDFVGVYDSVIGDSSLDNLNINMGAGADNLYMKGTNIPVKVKGNLNITTFANETEVEQDWIGVNNIKVGASVVVRTGAGEDTVLLNRMIAGNDLSLSTGDQNDMAILTEVQVIDDVWAYMGKGDDTLDIDDVSADRMELYGDAGRDKLIRRRLGQVNTNVSPVSFEQQSI
jgi:hypothetical protein